MPSKDAYAADVLKHLKKRYKGEMRTSLHHSNPWELLVATVLSAQAQDKHVNEVTEVLFKKYTEVEDYCKLRPSDLYRYIKSIGLYKGKAKNIVNAAKRIKKDFCSEVPRSMDELVTLPGVGRKTANVVLANAFGINSGIAIDTHCITVTNRLGFVKTENPVKIEKHLMVLFPKDEWSNVTHLFIALGRDVCTARAKHCERCVLGLICPSSTMR